MKDYLKIKNPLVDKVSLSDELNKEFNLNIKEEQVFFRKNVLILKVNAVQKSFVFMRKNAVLETVNRICPDRFIDTIQF